MNIIGTFKQDGEHFTGTVNTLAFAGTVSFVPVLEKRGEDSPDFKALGGRGLAEIGVAWKEESARGSSYLSVRLDDPSFPAPIFCRLVQFEGEEARRLIWSRA